MKTWCFFIVNAIGLCAVAGSDWGYSDDNGPEHWGGLCNLGKSQSPINIKTGKTKNADFADLRFTRYAMSFQGKVTNNGHTVQLQFESPIFLEGGGLRSTYIFEQLHFHWPSEHTVDGFRFALEAHFVHHSDQYSNVSEASQHENGIAVVAVLYEVSNADNADLMPIVKSVETVSAWSGQKTTSLKSEVCPYRLLPIGNKSYYRYFGSLTTPGCGESVIWFVLAEKAKISKQQLNVFKNVESDHGVLNKNYRPTQPLMNRVIYYSSVATIQSNLFLTLLSFMLVKLLFTK